MAPFSRVKVSQLNLIDLVTKVVDLHAEISTITYTVENENLYLHHDSPDGIWLDRADGDRHNLIVADGVTMIKYVAFAHSQPCRLGTNSIFDSTTDDRMFGSPMQADEELEPSRVTTFLDSTEFVREGEEEC
jgi:hypothetical protein